MSDAHHQIEECTLCGRFRPFGLLCVCQAIPADAEQLARIREEGRLCAADVCRHCAAGREFRVVRYSDTLARLEHPGIPSFPDVGIECEAGPIHLRWIVLDKLAGFFSREQAVAWFEDARIEGRHLRDLITDGRTQVVLTFVDELREATAP